MTDIRSFPPIEREHATVLILGSMPGGESLKRKQYYAHPRNAFWPIMDTLFGLTGTGYEEKARELAEKGVAVWDVLKACFRTGSLDANIDDSTIVVNDFRKFFDGHPALRNIYFNGAKADSVYRKHVLPGLDSHSAGLPLTRLPSTSPANAGMSLEQKAKAWRIMRGGSLE
jgi:TDG/mug DNA glycosylase family protein